MDVLPFPVPEWSAACCKEILNKSGNFKKSGNLLRKIIIKNKKNTEEIYKTCLALLTNATPVPPDGLNVKL